MKVMLGVYSLAANPANLSDYLWTWDDTPLATTFSIIQDSHIGKKSCVWSLETSGDLFCLPQQPRKFFCQGEPSCARDPGKVIYMHLLEYYKNLIMFVI